MRRDLWQTVLGHVDERRGTHLAEPETTDSSDRDSDHSSDTADDSARNHFSQGFFNRCDGDNGDDDEDEDELYYSGTSLDIPKLEQFWWEGNAPDVHHYEYSHRDLFFLECNPIYRQTQPGRI